MRSACWFQAKRTQRSHSNAEPGSAGTQNSLNAKFRQIVQKLRRTVTEIQAIMLVGPHGLVDHVLDDPAMNLETIAGEYATLLRIARSASQDSGSGNLVENIMVTDSSIIIARSLTPDHYLILLFRAQDWIGRARYELKQAAREFSDPGFL